ncbi:regulator of chromosome condensation 1/beta-lactamase-inhibitor protein II, partial [Baffinella frigidus]
LSCGYRHCCQLFPCIGRIKCWGEGTDGQLGYDSTESVGTAPEQMGANLPYVQIENVKAVRCGGGLICARMQTGDVKCWGTNAYGSLGYGDVVNRGKKAETMGVNLPVLDFGTNYVISMTPATDWGANCAVMDSARLMCWGENTHGQAGTGSAETKQLAPAYVSLGTTMGVRQVSSDRFSTCPVFTDGTIKCWGLGTQGDLGYNDKETRGNNADTMGDNLPFISMGFAVVDLKKGGYLHSCGMSQSGLIKCWGVNSNGMLGRG